MKILERLEKMRRIRKKNQKQKTDFQREKAERGVWCGRTEWKRERQGT